MLLLVPIAFAAGVITAFTPCILPVLPIVLAGGGTGTRRRPYAIVAGLVTTFTAFVLAGAWIWGLIGVDEKYQIKIGAVMLVVLAVTLVVPKVATALERPFSRLSRRPNVDLGGGFLLGAALGLVFVPCGGPVLAAVSANVARDRVGGWTVAVAVAYACGAALPMLLVAYGGRGVASRLRAHAHPVRVAAAVLLVGAAFLLYDPLHEHWAERLQTTVPAWARWAQDLVEGSSPADTRLERLTRNGKAVFGGDEKRLASRLVNVPLRNYGVAPDVEGISAWINSPALTMKALRGKVVLVDFWTYSCINCLRTLPYLKRWDERYRSKGLVILGVHTPEFAFEHDLGNVRSAVRRLGIRYPVALDNKYGTWDAYGNQYWPADYLIDQAGHVRHFHFGEGDYDGTERDIRLLLRASRGSQLPAFRSEPDRTPTETRTPESYLGYSRIEGYAGSPLRTDTAASYDFPRALARDTFAYSGVWKVEEERIVAIKHARLRLHFHARTAHLVLTGRGVVSVLLNGEKLGTIHVTSDRLYTLAEQKTARDGLLELRFTPGLAAYAFTFG